MNEQDWSDYKRWRAIYGEPEIVSLDSYLYPIVEFPNGARFGAHPQFMLSKTRAHGYRSDGSPEYHPDDLKFVPVKRILYWSDNAMVTRGD